MAMIPSGGAYPGVINEAQLLAAAAANIAASSAAASASAGEAAGHASDAAGYAGEAAGHADDAAAAKTSAESSAAAAAAATAGMTAGPIDGIASSTQFVRGSDLRLGLRGGCNQAAVAIAPASGLKSTAQVSFAGGDFEICTMAAGRAWSASTVGIFDCFDGGLTVYTQGNDIKVSRSQQLLLATFSNAAPVGSPLYSPDFNPVFISYASGVMKVLAGETQVLSGSVNLTTLVPAVMYPSGAFSVGALVGVHHSIAIFNRALTAAERLAWSRGEWTSAMVTAVTARYEPENCTTARWVDTSGNCRDLSFGTGVTPLMPRAGMTRTINAKAAGATVGASTVASIGTISGIAAADTAALAAIRQWDAVSAHHAQARPANSGALIATTPSAGAVTVEAQATTSAATFAANHALKLVHHL